VYTKLHLLTNGGVSKRKFVYYGYVGPIISSHNIDPMVLAITGTIWLIAVARSNSYVTNG
jgi:hypothetical protein